MIVLNVVFQGFKNISSQIFHRDDVLKMRNGLLLKELLEEQDFSPVLDMS
jgi:hypothetical protein